MSRINNCIYLCCDRCGNSTYYASNLQLENSSWSLAIKVDDYSPLDLCPDCTEKWNTLVRNFLDNVDMDECRDAGGLY